MRALLVNPWITDFSAYDLWSKPLGLLKIAYYLKRSGFEVELIDCLDRFHPKLQRFLTKPLRGSIYGCGNYYFEEIEKPKILKDVPRRYKRYGLPIELFKSLLKEQKSPDVIFVTSGMTYWYPGVFEAIDLLKKQFSSTPIILGGIYATLCYQHAKENSGADIVYKGNKIEEIMSLISEKVNPEDDEDHYAYELYPNLGYITLRTSGGCPFRCTYCGWYLLEDKLWQAEPEAIINTIEHFYKMGIRNFSFYDDCLLYNSENHIIKILEGLKKRDIHCFFHTPNALNIRFISKRIARLLKESGFVNPRLGLEFTSSKMQQETGGKVSNKEFIRALRYLEEVGYSPKDVSVYLMMGLPGQSLDEIEESIRFLARFKVRIHLEEYAPVPGTPDYERSGLSKEVDPLLHNNSIFPLFREKYPEFQRLKDLVHNLNKI